MRQSEKWARRDPRLFAALRDLVDAGVRDVRCVESESLIPDAVFFEDVVPDLAGPRRGWFFRAMERLGGTDVVFFDPDNGFEVGSKPMGSRGSSKFVAWDEVSASWEKGLSLVVFQHWARVRRDEHVARLRARLDAVAPGASVDVIRTPNVGFFVLAQPDHVESMRAGLAVALRDWAGVMVADRRFPFTDARSLG